MRDNEGARVLGGGRIRRQRKRELVFKNIFRICIFFTINLYYMPIDIAWFGGHRKKYVPRRLIQNIKSRTK